LPTKITSLIRTQLGEWLNFAGVSHVSPVITSWSQVQWDSSKIATALSTCSSLGSCIFGQLTNSQWEFQHPKVLYHIRPYFMGMFPYIGLT
jgi:hypothetical protein